MIIEQKDNDGDELSTIKKCNNKRKKNDQMKLDIYIQTLFFGK